MNPKTPDQPVVIEKKFSRRDMLKTAGVGGVGALLGASGLEGLLAISENNTKNHEIQQIVTFYGKINLELRPRHKIMCTLLH